MTPSAPPIPRLATHVVNQLLAIKPLFNVAKHQARQMMVKRSATLGIDWYGEVAKLKSRGNEQSAFSPDWDKDFAAIANPNLHYPDYYLRPFHAYDQGNLSWQAATEVEVAAYAVHAWACAEDGAKGDAHLRQSYHDVVCKALPTTPQTIVDLGCGVGMSTFALQATFPDAEITGVDLSPYFVAVAQYQAQQKHLNIHWLHAAAEETPLPRASFDLVSVCLVYHELPQTAAIAILQEARRLLKPNGHLAIMDMNPHSEIYAKMPPYILTLLKSTEPYLDQYFALDLVKELKSAGFKTPLITANSLRHRTVLAQVH
jgi:ubiquinone/menaquinone biosynthesis C-methylase UbiE